MTRLSRDDREFIHAGFLKEAFTARQTAINKRELALATKVLIHRYGDDAFARFAALPEGWLPMVEIIGVRFEDLTWRLRLAEARPLPTEVYQGGNYELMPPLGRELKAIRVEHDRLHTERDALYKDIRAALAGFTTHAQLHDGWPEAYAYLSVPTGRQTNLPAIRVEDINARIVALREAA